MRCPKCGRMNADAATRCSCGHLLRPVDEAGAPSDGSAAHAQEALHYVVRYRLGQGRWEEYWPSKEEVVLGRAADCDIRLSANEVSRHHARLTFTPEGPFLTDLGSVNGTQVVDKPIPPNKAISLPCGQPFTICDYTLVVSREAPPAGASERLKAVPLPVGELTGRRLLPGSELPTLVGEEIQESLVTQHLDLSAYDRLSIGRASDNKLVLNHPLVSRYHAELERIGQRVQLRDLHSTNGVYVNHQRVQGQVWLRDGDRIQIGPYEFTLMGLSLRPRAEEGLLLEARNINQRVSKRLNLLQNISLVIQPMEFVAIVGMSGSGKTTLLNALSGYRPASDGQVLVNGIDLYRHYDLFRNDVGYVPQRDIVHVELTPYVALEYVAKLRMPPDTTPQERSKAVLEVLEELDLTERKDVPISRLSGGQLKRVSIGVELLTKPRLFFLDEPTSGLDPGTEYEMMKLLRRLADQGRTVILITHATKNVMLCDKVIFLARGGYLTFFGMPDEALKYFDAYRTPRERRQKEMEFDDIYRILNDERRGSPREWAERFRSSPHYRTALGQVADRGGGHRPSTQPTKVQGTLRRQGGLFSALRQFVILSARNLKILMQDKVSLALMLALAPGIGLLDFMWGRDLFDPVKGDAGKIFTMWFLSSLVTVLVGALSSVREIVKEDDIYRRERAVNLQILPYILSKVWVGVVLAFYQAAILFLSRILFTRPPLPDAGAYFALYGTLFISTLCGYLIGLMISASAPNQNAAMLLIIVVLVPQFMFAGALMPLDLIPGGEVISTFMPTRWTFEAFVNLSGMGKKLIQDPCWARPKSERKALSEAQKADCPCFGANIFTRCNDFPGVLSPDFYDARAQKVLSQPAPTEPPQPTAYPYPTAYPSPTPLPTPTLLPSFTPLPTPTLLPSPTPYPSPADIRKMLDYLKQRQKQGQDYQDVILDQFAAYRKESEKQGERYQDLILEQFSAYRRASEKQGQEYADRRTQQGDEYAALRQKQGDEYKAAMQAYGDARSAYEEARQKAISGAEAMLETIYDNYGRAFKGTVTQRWGVLGAIMAGLVVLLVVFQKRKDVV